HQPYRLKKYATTDVTINHSYDDDNADKTAINIAADISYLPMNEIILMAIRESKGEFKVSYSVSGVTLELLNRYRPDVISSFKQLTETGCVEILAETYYHSLSSIH